MYVCYSDQFWDGAKNSFFLHFFQKSRLNQGVNVLSVLVGEKGKEKRKKNIMLVGIKILTCNRNTCW